MRKKCMKLHITSWSFIHFIHCLLILVLTTKHNPQILPALFLVGCANGETSANSTDNSSSPTSSSFAAEYKENNKRPYFEEDTYFTVHEEATINSYEFATDQAGNPTLNIWLTYKNVGDSDKAPISVQSYFHFFQNEQEIEKDFAYFSEDFSAENPQYGEAYERAIYVISPGEEAEIYLAIPLQDTSEVRVEFDERNPIGEKSSIVFNIHES